MKIIYVFYYLAKSMQLNLNAAALSPYVLIVINNQPEENRTEPRIPEVFHCALSSCGPSNKSEHKFSSLSISVSNISMVNNKDRILTTVN